MEDHRARYRRLRFLRTDSNLQIPWAFSPLKRHNQDVHRSGCWVQRFGWAVLSPPVIWTTRNHDPPATRLADPNPTTPAPHGTDTDHGTDGRPAVSSTIAAAWADGPTKTPAAPTSRWLHTRSGPPPPGRLRLSIKTAAAADPDAAADRRTPPAKSSGQSARTAGDTARRRIGR